MPRGGARAGAGRPAKVLDLEQLEKLAMIHCTEEEIAGFFDLTREQFNKRKNASRDLLEVMDKGRAKGKSSLRREQYKKAMEGNATMLIWLGKQLLGQKDTVVTEHAGELTVNDGAKERLISKLASLAAARSDQEGDQRIN